MIVVPLNSYVRNLDKRFWLYNYFASLVYFAMSDFRSISSFVLFPIAIMLLTYLLTERLHTTADTQYLGLYPLGKDFGKVVIAGLLNYVLWHVSGLLFFVAFFYILWKEYH